MPRDWILKSRSLATLGMTGGIGVLGTIGGIAVLGIIVGLVLLRHEPNDAHAGVLRQAATQIQSAEHERAAVTAAIGYAKVKMRETERESKSASARAAEARDRVRVVSADDTVVSPGPAAVPMVLRVPSPVIHLLRLDSAAVEALGTLVRWKDTVIVRQDQRIGADSIELVATQHAFTALQRTKEPRCGRKCGIILGIGGMLAAAVSIEQVRRAFR